MPDSPTHTIREQDTLFHFHWHKERSSRRASCKNVAPTGHHVNADPSSHVYMQSTT